MKRIKRVLGCSALLCAIISLGTGRSIGSGWDTAFHSSFMNNVGNYFYNEGVYCITTLGSEVYIGTQSLNGGGAVWRYKESDGSWAELANVNGGVRSLSAAEDDNGTKWLCVGGEFTEITYGMQYSDANNVALLNLTSGWISKMQGWWQVEYGTDGPVYAVKTLPWYGGFSGAGVKVLVGGMFANAGPVSSKSIALWSQLGFGGWTGFAGGLDDDGIDGMPKVHGIEAVTTESGFGETAFSGIWITGALRKESGTNKTIHIAKLTGSTNSWTYLGRGFQTITLDTQTCTYTPSTYSSFYGRAICQAGTNVYFGGFSRGHQTIDGTVYFVPLGEECGCSGCPSGYSGLVKLGGSSTLFEPSCELKQVEALAGKGGDVYASGVLWEDEDTVYFARYSEGGWTEIPCPSGLEYNYATAAASTAAHVYFVRGYCWRYTP